MIPLDTPGNFQGGGAVVVHVKPASYFLCLRVLYLFEEMPRGRVFYSVCEVLGRNCYHNELNGLELS